MRQYTVMIRRLTKDGPVEAHFDLIPKERVSPTIAFLVLDMEYQANMALMSMEGPPQAPVRVHIFEKE